MENGYQDVAQLKNDKVLERLLRTGQGHVIGPGRPAGGVEKSGRIESHNGVIDIRLPAQARFRVNASGHHMGVDSDFPMVIDSVERSRYVGDVNGGGGVDRFRIKVWNTATGSIVFDNQMGGSDDLSASPTEAVSGGSIVIHK